MEGQKSTDGGKGHLEVASSEERKRLELIGQTGEVSHNHHSGKVDECGKTCWQVQEMLR